MSKVDRFFKVSPASYDSYVRGEWQNYLDHPYRAEASLAALGDLVVEQVLDVGCGGGQELLPFLARTSALGIGVDIVQDTGRAGRELFSTRGEQARVSFVRAAAEALPFPTSSFDVVVCRLALPYTENDRALEEMGRVLRPNGIVLLKIQRATFYLEKIKHGVRTADPRCVVHALRVLASGIMYHVTSRQPRTQLTGGETFQSRGLLQRKLAPLGMFIAGQTSESSASTPSFIIKKLQQNGRVKS
ncbi:MAG: class I SAM-dependent methyltransferase [Pyrinomonadaceae bacterium]